MIIGYARVSTTDQNAALQVAALEAAGCQKIFIDKASGATAADARPQLKRALAYNNRGDLFVVWKIDRLARSLSNLLAIVCELNSRGVHFRCLTQPIDTASPAGRLTLQIIGACAEFERELIRERTKAGLDNAKKNGVKLGAPAKFTAAMAAEARAKRAMGLTNREIHRALGVSQAAFYNGLKRHPAPP